MEQLLFLDITYNPTVNSYEVILPPTTYEFQSLTHMRILCWAMEGVTLTTTNGGLTITGPLYFQLKFRQDLECGMWSNVGTDMVQLPLECMGGWPCGQMGTNGFSIPIRRNIQQVGRVNVSVYGPGSNPSPLVFSRLCLWIALAYKSPMGTTRELTL